MKNKFLYLDSLKQYAQIEKLSRTVLTKLIDYIIVSEKCIVNGEKQQRVKIIYNFVGELN
jgi:hypothetical protein